MLCSFSCFLIIKSILNPSCLILHRVWERLQRFHSIQKLGKALYTVVRNHWLQIFIIFSLSIESWLPLKQWTAILDKPKESYEGISGATADTLCIPSPPGDLDRHILDHNSQSYWVLLLRGALSLIQRTFTEHLYVSGTVSGSQLEWYFPFKEHLELCGNFS